MKKRRFRMHGAAARFAASVALCIASTGVSADEEPKAGDGTAEIAADGSVADDGAVALRPVTVTAERRETQLHQTPATISVVDADKLDKSVRRINDLAGLAPGVTVATRTYTPAIFIRGVGSTRPIGNQSVGIYLDDVYIARPFGAGQYGALPDTERVEVLSGPQGTLYGKNTGGGAIKLVTRQPSEYSGGWVGIGIGDKTNEARGYVSGALVRDVLSGSLAFSHNEIYDDTENVTLGKDVNGLSSQQVRGILQWTPDESLEATVTLDAQESETAYVLSSIGSPGDAVRRTASDIDGDQDYNGWGVSGVVQKNLGDASSIRSVTSFRDAEIVMPTDSDGLDGYVSGFVQDLDMRQFSQEFQLLGDYGRWSFVSGLVFFRERFGHYRWSWSNDAFSIIDSDVASTTIGLYGQANYKLTEKLTATAGVRLSRETSELDSAGYSSNLAGEAVAQTYRVGGLKKDWDSVQPKLALSYQWNPGLLTYASFARGSTAGGYNSAAATLSIAQVPVNPDRIDAYEAGLKTLAWDGRLTTSTALFYNDYKDYQATIRNPIIDGQLVTGAVFANAGRAHTYGLEFASTAKLGQSLDVALTFAWLKTRFDEYLNPTGAANSNFVGYDLPNAPEYSGGLRLNYSHDLHGGGTWVLNGSWRYEDESYSSVSADREYGKSPVQNYVDAGAYYTTASRLWTLSLSATNLLDKDYGLPGGYSAAQGYYNVLWNRERQVTFGIRRDFF